MNIGIYIYNQAEVLDFSGPFEVFSTACRVSETDNSFRPFLIGETGETVVARAGFRVVPDYGFHNHPAIDVLIVAGGVHDAEMDKTRVIEWISHQSETAEIVASVCTGVFLLAQAGITCGRRVTSHWEDIPELKKLFPTQTVLEGVRWVDEGDLVTSGGISAGIDMCLHLVSRLQGDALATKTARQMEFLWTRNP